MEDADRHLRPFQTRGPPILSAVAPVSYVNLLSEDEVARVPDADGANHARLAAVKKRWDPANVFSRMPVTSLT